VVFTIWMTFMEIRWH